MSKTAKEIEIKIFGGRITKSVVLEDGTCKLTVEMLDSKEPVAATVVQEKTANTDLTDAFVFVEASKLSLEDEFMKYNPRTEREKTFKKQLAEVIKSGVKDFWAPKYDPSFNEAGTGICYVPGKKPAVRKSYNWWEKIAKEFCPERESHLGSKSERIAFMGIFIKELVKSGWKVEDAWSAVCCDSKELGHYWNSKDAKHAFENTGSREVCGFFDNGNTYKILAYDEEAGGFWLAGGYSLNLSHDYPLADLVQFYNQDGNHYNGVGWLVLY